ncbi:Hypothetical protein ING2D1G_0278 [Peptoniphilus sp. ING2-D1G]|nr:Hypothetical protein ING2D1G_0278 [Peptoniphilus sp. ING2-D1G]
MTKKTLELSFVDENDKSIRFSLQDPRDGILKGELVEFESYIVTNELFIGPTGKITGFGTAKYKEVTETDLLV